MKELNSRFKKGMFLSLAGLAGAILSQYLIARDWPVPETMYSIAIGISVVFAIYFTYYYTEALVMEARIQEKTAVTRNSYVCRNICALLCIQINYNNVVYSC